LWKYCVFLFLVGIWRLILCLWFVIWKWSHGRHILLICQLIWRSIMPQSLFRTKWLIGLSSLSDGPLICSFRYGWFISPFFSFVILIKSIEFFYSLDFINSLCSYFFGLTDYARFCFWWTKIEWLSIKMLLLDPKFWFLCCFLRQYRMLGLSPLLLSEL